MSVESRLGETDIRERIRPLPLVVIGLGNPGPKYVETRHNFGFFVLDELSQRFRDHTRYRLLGHEHKAGLARWEHWSDDHQRETFLLWPLTYMNVSGRALEWLEARTGILPIEPEQILVLVDDMSLPLGQMRLRKKGSSGGHNGLKSIEASLGNQGYPRLRLGIGAPGPSEDIVEYVLAPFRPEEWDTVREMICFAAMCVMDMNDVSLERHMGKVNGWRAGATPEEPSKPSS